MGVTDRFQRAWNAFRNKEPTYPYGYGSGYGRRPDRLILTGGNDRSIINSIFNRIAVDASSVGIKHCKNDKNGRYEEDVDSGLNNCLNLEANIDQTGRAFLQDLVMSMLDEGCVGAIPIDTDEDPLITDSYIIGSMRTCKILEWYPRHVKVRVYNDQTGKREDVVVPKRIIAIIENPLYTIVNEPNSQVQRLAKKLRLLDVTDEKTASGKLDIIVQLPYQARSLLKKEQAETRRKDIEDQLVGSKYGVAYIDATEKIIQLNRPVENNLMNQVEYLTNQVFAQIGITQSILDGTADEKTMLNYMNRTIEPIVSAIVDEFKRKFLTKTARTQGQTIQMFKDPFRLVPVNNIADIADKFTRNEIMTSNEMRQVIGMKPSKDPKADELRNSNISQAKEGDAPVLNIQDQSQEGGNNQNE
ncbi:phage portal protein [Coprococcus sp. HCN-4056]|uniref:phage portal protein n=1 Tax=Coprococcus sp. HCN-4056 TaxID=3134671 RepID=UPI0030C1B632